MSESVASLGVGLVVAVLFVAGYLHERAVKLARADEAKKWERWLVASDEKLQAVLKADSQRQQIGWEFQQAARREQEERALKEEHERQRRMVAEGKATRYST